MGVNVLTAGDLVGWEESIGRGRLSCGDAVKPIGREASELYTPQHSLVAKSYGAVAFLDKTTLGTSLSPAIKGSL
jgi:hypothetical protein